MEILPELELPLRQSEVELPVSAVPEDGSEAVHEPPLHQVLVMSGPEVDRQPGHSSPGDRCSTQHSEISSKLLLRPALSCHKAQGIKNPTSVVFLAFHCVFMT